MILNLCRYYLPPLATNRKYSRIPRPLAAWRFIAKGELINFVSNDRFAVNENNTMQRLSWSTPMKDYREVDGYRHATYAEAIYIYVEGDLYYVTFSLKHIKYNCR